MLMSRRYDPVSMIHEKYIEQFVRVETRHCPGVLLREMIKCQQSTYTPACIV